jgi:hypothetical protein
MQASALHWCRDVAGQRKHRGLNGQTPAEVFDQIEAGTLTPLPAAAFTLAEWSRAKVAPDVHVKCGKALYSGAVEADRPARRHPCHSDDGADLPPRRAGEDPRPQGQRPGHGGRGLPTGEDRLHMRTPTWCRQRASRPDPRPPRPSPNSSVGRRCSGCARRRRSSPFGKYSDTRLEAACRKAAAAGDPSYRTIRNILAAGLEAVEHHRPTGDAGAPAFLHGPAGLFADVIPFPGQAAATTIDTTSTTASDRRVDAGHGEPEDAAS